MAVNLSPFGGVGAQFLDNSGNVLTGGKIYTYAAGTTTNQATYTSSLGNTPLPNPIILDAAGRVPTGEIWLTDSLIYKFVLKDSNDVLIATYDNIIGINSNFVAYTTEQEIQTATAGQTVFDLANITYQPGTNSLSVFVDGVNQYGPGAQYAYVETDSDTVTFTNGLHVGAQVKFTTAALTTGNATNASVVAFTGFNGQTGSVQDLADDDGSDWIGFEQSGTGAVARSAQDKMRDVVSIKDFGAVGDGVTDDTAAIQDALDYATTISSAVYAPAGTYLLSATVVVPSNITLYGDGIGTQFERDTTATPFDFFELKNVSNITLQNFYINGVTKLDNGTASNRYCGIRVWADGGARSNNIDIIGVSIDKTTSGETQTEGNRAAILLEDCYNIRLSRCKFYDNRATAILITIKNGTTGYNTNNIQINDCYGVGEVAPFIPAFPAGFGSFISGSYHTDVLVSGCYVDGFGFSNISMNGPRSTVQNCISKNSVYVGINLGHSTTGDNCDDSIVDGNITTNNTLSGITVVASKNVIVSNNTSYDDGNTSGWPALRVLHDATYDSGETTNVTIIGNQFLNSTFGAIAVEAGTYVQITSNLFANCSTTALFLREKEVAETMWAFVSNNVFIDNGGSNNSAIEVNTSVAGGFGSTNVVAKDNFIYSSDIATKQRWGITSVGDATSVMQVNNNWFSSNYNGSAVNTNVATYGYALNKFGTSSLTNANIVNA